MKRMFPDYSLIEREKMENEIALDPLAWPLIRGTGGVRKARFSRGNRGKSGGGRVCYLYVQVMETIYMLKAYGKNEQEDLSDTEKKLIKKLGEKILDIEGY
jgi:mRNA-degrading endonuclease RelE of RelBE toxin-antitoxin system